MMSEHCYNITMTPKTRPEISQGVVWITWITYSPHNSTYRTTRKWFAKLPDKWGEKVI